jgi:hypoxanthine phosphoribosyltransferase
MGKIDYTWRDFEEDVNNILTKQFSIKKRGLKEAQPCVLSKYCFKTVVGVSKGGLPLAVLLANRLNLPLQIIEASSYENKIRKKLKLSCLGSSFWKSPLLIVVDVADSGYTLMEINKSLGADLKNHFFLTLFLKQGSVFKPDYFCKEVTKSTWVNFPWE